MVLKRTKIYNLIAIAILFFLTGYFGSFFYYLGKDTLWEIRIGFPFPHFGYHFMGGNCENFVWGYGSGAGKNGHWAMLNPVLCVLICYFIYLIFKNIKVMRSLFRFVILPVLIFCSISFLSFFPLEKQKVVNDILIGFPFKFYEYRRVGKNCLTFVEKWDILFLTIDFVFIYIIYFLSYLFLGNIRTKG